MKRKSYPNLRQRLDDNPRFAHYCNKKGTWFELERLETFQPRETPPTTLVVYGVRKRR